MRAEREDDALFDIDAIVARLVDVDARRCAVLPLRATPRASDVASTTSGALR
jgi:hypothetical protein